MVFTSILHFPRTFHRLLDVLSHIVSYFDFCAIHLATARGFEMRREDMWTELFNCSQDQNYIHDQDMFSVVHISVFT